MTTIEGLGATILGGLVTWAVMSGTFAFSAWIKRKVGSGDPETYMRRSIQHVYLSLLMLVLIHSIRREWLQASAIAAGILMCVSWRTWRSKKT